MVYFLFGFKIAFIYYFISHSKSGLFYFESSTNSVLHKTVHSLFIYVQQHLLSLIPFQHPFISGQRTLTIVFQGRNGCLPLSAYHFTEILFLMSLKAFLALSSKQ